MPPTVTYAWGEANTSSQNWVVSLRGPYSNVTVTWGSNVPLCTDYAPRSPENPRAAARRVCDDFRRLRRCELMRRLSISCNLIVNLRFNFRGDDREGLVTQYFLLQISVSTVCNFSFIYVSIVSSYIWIACRIAFCVICVF